MRHQDQTLQSSLPAELSGARPCPEWHVGDIWVLNHLMPMPSRWSFFWLAPSNSNSVTFHFPLIAHPLPANWSKVSVPFISHRQDPSISPLGTPSQFAVICLHLCLCQPRGQRRQVVSSLWQFVQLVTRESILVGCSDMDKWTKEYLGKAFVDLSTFRVGGLGEEARGRLTNAWGARPGGGTDPDATGTEKGLITCLKLCPKIVLKTSTCNFIYNSPLHRMRKFKFQRANW